MKNIKKIFAILTLLMLALSCENDGGDSKIDTKYGAVVDIQKQSNTDNFIDLLAVQAGGDFNIGFSVNLGIGEISSIDIVGFYIKANGTLDKATLFSNIVSLPKTFTLKHNDLYNAFDNVNTPADFESGDKLIISAEITLKNGTLLKIINDDASNNFSSNIATSNLYKVFQTYNVACASYLAGTYQFTTTNVKAPTGESAAGPLTGTVTFEDLGGGLYEISDGSFGGWNGLYGSGPAIGVQLQDSCNKISFQGEDQYGEIFTMTNLVVNGTKISFHWENDYGEFGDTTLKRTDGSNWPALTL